MRMIVSIRERTRLLVYVSHLDLQRFFQLALNRTGLPIAFSNGFNPHPVMAFGSALALGWTSEYGGHRRKAGGGRWASAGGHGGHAGGALPPGPAPDRG